MFIMFLIIFILSLKDFSFISIFILMLEFLSFIQEEKKFEYFFLVF